MAGRFKAATARVRILESETRANKAEFEMSKKTFIEKSENDDKYIRALRSELTKLKEEVERLRNAPPETVTRVIYKAPEELRESQRHNSMMNFSQDDGDELTKVANNFMLVEKRSICKGLRAKQKRENHSRADGGKNRSRETDCFCACQDR